MNKTTAVFQIVTEICLIGLFAVCLAPSTFVINIDLWGLKMDLSMKDLLHSSESITVFGLVASISMFFVVILFSFTAQDSRRKKALRTLRQKIVKLHNAPEDSSKKTENGSTSDDGQ